MRNTSHPQQQPTDMWADERQSPWLLAFYAAVFFAAIGLSALFPNGWMQ